MTKLHDLLQKEMTRKQFLLTVGLAITSLFGMGSILKLLGSSLEQEQGQTAQAKGNTAYGNKKNQA